MISWENLSDDEKSALKRMNSRPYPSLSAEIAKRLVSMGLAEVRPGGVGINRAGGELVIDHLLTSREDG